MIRVGKRLALLPGWAPSTGPLVEPDMIPPTPDQQGGGVPSPSTGSPKTDTEFLALWRKIAIATATGLIAFTVVIDNLGRLFLDPSFHVSEVIFGTLVGAWTLLLGFEGLDRLRNGKSHE